MSHVSLSCLGFVLNAVQNKDGPLLPQYLIMLTLSPFANQHTAAPRTKTQHHIKPTYQHISTRPLPLLNSHSRGFSRFIQDSPRSEPQSTLSPNSKNTGPVSERLTTGDSRTPPISVPSSSFTSPKFSKDFSNIDTVMETTKVTIRRELLDGLVKGGLATRHPLPNMDATSYGTYETSNLTHHSPHVELIFMSSTPLL